MVINQALARFQACPFLSFSELGGSRDLASLGFCGQVARQLFCFCF